MIATSSLHALRAALPTALVAAALGLAALPAAAQKVLKVGIGLSEDHPQGIAIKKFGEILSHKTGGKLTAKLFASGTLGNDVTMISALRGGTQEMVCPDSSTLTSLVKEFGVLNLPKQILSEQEADALLDGPFGQKLLDKLPEKGLIGLAYWEHGFRSITNSKRPITKWEDLQGLKLRSIQIPIFIDINNTLGANAVPMPFTELYTALESKAVDGQDNALPTIESARLNEVQKYLSLTRIVYDPLVVLFSKKTWDRLNADEQKILREAAQEATAFQRKLNRERQVAFVQAAPAKGMAVNELSEAERARMREQLKPVTEKYSKELDPELLKEFLSEVQKARVAAK